MAIGLNKCAFIGNLGRDPETMVAKSGIKVTKFSIGVNEKFKEQENTTWINIVTFDKLAEITSQYCRKGQLVYAEGRLQIRSYDRQDGSKGTAVELLANQVIFLEKKRDAVEQQQLYGDSGPSAVPGGAAVADDDLPF